MMLEVGMKAPLFTLLDKNGNLVSLSDFLGKKVVLYFYPKDNTPGCTRQACAFACSAFVDINESRQLAGSYLINSGIFAFKKNGYFVFSAF